MKCFYSKQATDTIISPTDIVLINHLTQHHTWTQYADLIKGTRYIKFENTETNHHIMYPLILNNDLWFYTVDDSIDYHSDQHTYSAIPGRPIIKRLSTAGSYEIIHARLGHPGTKVMSTLHHHIDGLTQLHIPPIYRCRTYMLVKATKRAITHHELSQVTSKTRVQHSATGLKDSNLTLTEQDVSDLHCTPGERFHMDIGFVRGTKYSTKDEDGTTVTNLDGYNSYILIIDRATRYIWVFPAHHKTPRIDLIKTFLNTHGAKNT